MMDDKNTVTTGVEGSHRMLPQPQGDNDIEKNAGFDIDLEFDIDTGEQVSSASPKRQDAAASGERFSNFDAPGPSAPPSRSRPSSGPPRRSGSRRGRGSAPAGTCSSPSRIPQPQHGDLEIHRILYYFVFFPDLQDTFLVCSRRSSFRLFLVITRYCLTARPSVSEAAYESCSKPNGVRKRYFP